MILKELRLFFSEALAAMYPKTEVDTFFYLLIEEYLNFKRIDTILKGDFEINKGIEEKFLLALKRLKNEEPIQYILEKTEFYGLPFKVNKHTLIPRPETEELVQWIIDEVRTPKKMVKILDIGTGSGCIPVSLKVNIENSLITAIDVSTEAISIAKQNALTNNVAIDFINLDILNTSVLPENYDIIVSNPPYVRNLEKREIKNNVLQNEPHLALFVEDDNALIFYDKISKLASKHLNENGILFFEINQYLGLLTTQLIHKNGFTSVELKKDLFGNDRMIKATL